MWCHKIRFVWQKPRIVTKFKSLTLWHFEMSQNVAKCFEFLVQNYVYLLQVDFARNASESVTLKILQIQKPKLFGINSNQTKIWTWIWRYRENWFSQFGGFRGCGIFSENCHRKQLKNVQFLCPTWLLGFQLRRRKSSSDVRGLPSPCYYLKIGFCENLQISGEIQYLNGPINYQIKSTIWKEASIVHVGAVITHYRGKRAIWSRKRHILKYCPGDLTSLNTDNVDFYTPSHLYKAIRPRSCFSLKENVCYLALGLA